MMPELWFRKNRMKSSLFPSIEHSTEALPRHMRAQALFSKFRQTRCCDVDNSIKFLTCWKKRRKNFAKNSYASFHFIAPRLCVSHKANRKIYGRCLICIMKNIFFVCWLSFRIRSGAATIWGRNSLHNELTHKIMQLFTYLHLSYAWLNVCFCPLKSDFFEKLLSSEFDSSIFISMMGKYIKRT